MRPEKLPVLLMFAPERWGEVERFSNLCSASFAFTPLEKRFVSGVTNHFNKALTLEALAVKLRPNLEIDRRELDERGHTPALNSNELSAVVEAAILELYSSLDCAAKVVIAIYNKRSVRGLKDSSRGLFHNTDKITGPFPEVIKTALREAVWYEDLRFLRDELTHRQTGSCNLDHKTGIVSYMHPGIIRDGRAFIIDDIFAWFQQKAAAVNLFLGAVFHELNTRLSPTPVHVVCGMTEGRFLMRQLDPSKPLSFDSGVCLSYPWFDKPGNVACPFLANCGAYRNAKEGGAP